MTSNKTTKRPTIRLTTEFEDALEAALRAELDVKFSISIHGNTFCEITEFDEVGMVGAWNSDGDTGTAFGALKQAIRNRANGVNKNA